MSDADADCGGVEAFEESSSRCSANECDRAEVGKDAEVVGDVADGSPEFGRDSRSIEVVAAPVAAELEVVKQYEDAGADGIVVFVMPAAEQDMLDELEQIAAKLIR